MGLLPGPCINEDDDPSGVDDAGDVNNGSAVGGMVEDDDEPVPGGGVEGTGAPDEDEDDVG